eukprot:TRINITY_DN9025_c0_g1_i1.p1 TRINITY_DN9025_c0_g1~~TRINITY_DN9025_c0_g1_i1.p1  ORF type:complete len:904 (+),score=227.55 TRINITY_DN9025_c0_g1_i1:30-2741(+)
MIVSTLSRTKNLKKAIKRNQWNRICRKSHQGLAITRFISLENNVYQKSSDLNCKVAKLVDVYRKFGHLFASVNPLQNGVQNNDILDPATYGIDINDPAQIPLADIQFHIPGKRSSTVKDLISHLKQTYIGDFTVESSYLKPNESEWINEAVELDYHQYIKQMPDAQRRKILKFIVESEQLDSFLHMRFSSLKRYALQGAETLIVCLDQIFETAAKNGISDVVIGMPHRGRLNTLSNLLKYPESNLFSKISGHKQIPEHVFGTDDVLSHISQSITLNYGSEELNISLINNPSHLEAEIPVVLGKARAKQDYYNGNDQVLCIMIHGDAAMSGQGILYETAHMTNIESHSTNGVIHITVNNQVGFTMEGAKGGRGSTYCTDVAKVIDAPVIHVNANNPDAVVSSSNIAVGYQREFGKDVFIDLVGYRRYGHNELDEPRFTNPSMYEKIRKMEPVPKLYFNELYSKNIVSKEEYTEMIEDYKNHLISEKEKIVTDSFDHLQGKWENMNQATDMKASVETGVSIDMLKEVGIKSIESEIKIHPSIKKMFAQKRLAKMESGKDIDWATAETLAFGSLLLEGYNIRISGQDVERGTFSQRHHAFVDQKTGEKHYPLNQLASKQGKFYSYSSFLSEYGVLGFEYGYSIETPKNLVIWEAQYGDFVNTAQVILDQFIFSGEDKWLRQSGLVVLLPHGYDGAGPEHSSCKLERFLAAANVDVVNDSDINKRTNMRVVFPTTAANCFHMLRRQMITDYRKPLIVASPKAFLRNPATFVTLDDLAPGTTFQPVIDDEEQYKETKKLVFCSGNVYYDLAKHRQENNIDMAIVRIEELVPFPSEKVNQILEKYSHKEDIVWYQEEPQNGGAFRFVDPIFRNICGTELRYVGQEPLAPSAQGTKVLHNESVQRTLQKL